MYQYWYLSFADNEGFLGACVVEARDLKEAIIKTHTLGINPGGEIRAMNVPFLGPLPLDWLLSKEDIDKVDKAVKWTTTSKKGDK